MEKIECHNFFQIDHSRALVWKFSFLYKYVVYEQTKKLFLTIYLLRCYRHISTFTLAIFRLHFSFPIQMYYLVIHNKTYKLLPCSLFYGYWKIRFWPFWSHCFIVTFLRPYITFFYQHVPVCQILFPLKYVLYYQTTNQIISHHTPFAVVPSYRNAHIGKLPS